MAAYIRDRRNGQRLNSALLTRLSELVRTCRFLLSHFDMTSEKPLGEHNMIKSRVIRWEPWVLDGSLPSSTFCLFVFVMR